MDVENELTNKNSFQIIEFFVFRHCLLQSRISNRFSSKKESVCSFEDFNHFYNVLHFAVLELLEIFGELRSIRSNHFDSHLNIQLFLHTRIDPVAVALFKRTSSSIIVSAFQLLMNTLKIIHVNAIIIIHWDITASFPLEHSPLYLQMFQFF